MKKVEILKAAVCQIIPDELISCDISFGELTIVVDANNIKKVIRELTTNPQTMFEQCVDLCGVDYSTFHDDYVGKRFAVVYHLLSISKNWRIRVKTFANDDDFPVIDSITDIHNGMNWFEREAFDLYGIMFEGHPDLRRILTDYGFIGHPFRKDFPISGYVEMKYDDEQKRVIYQPVTIEPREITPRVIREENYGRN